MKKNLSHYHGEGRLKASLFVGDPDSYQNPKADFGYFSALPKEVLDFDMLTWEEKEPVEKGVCFTVVRMNLLIQRSSRKLGLRVMPVINGEINKMMAPSLICSKYPIMTECAKVFIGEHSSRNCGYDLRVGADGYLGDVSEITNRSQFTTIGTYGDTVIKKGWTATLVDFSYDPDMVSSEKLVRYLSSSLGVQFKKSY